MFGSRHRLGCREPRLPTCSSTTRGARHPGHQVRVALVPAELAPLALSRLPPLRRARLRGLLVPGTARPRAQGRPRAQVQPQEQHRLPAQSRRREQPRPRRECKPPARFRHPPAGTNSGAGARCPRLGIARNGGDPGIRPRSQRCGPGRPSPRHGLPRPRRIARLDPGLGGRRGPLPRSLHSRRSPLAARGARASRAATDLRISAVSGTCLGGTRVVNSAPAPGTASGPGTVNGPATANAPGSVSSPQGINPRLGSALPYFPHHESVILPHMEASEAMTGTEPVTSSPDVRPSPARRSAAEAPTPPAPSMLDGYAPV